MAGSYRHVTHADGDGSLRVATGTDEAFDQMIDNLGDAYEAIEEMYGMIWFLANSIGDDRPISARDAVESARRNYEEGLEIAKRASQEARS